MLCPHLRYECGNTNVRFSVWRGMLELLQLFQDLKTNVRKLWEKNLIMGFLEFEQVNDMSLEWSAFFVSGLFDSRQPQVRPNHATFVCDWRHDLFYGEIECALVAGRRDRADAFGAVGFEKASSEMSQGLFTRHFGGGKGKLWDLGLWGIFVLNLRSNTSLIRTVSRF